MTIRAEAITTDPRWWAQRAYVVGGLVVVGAIEAVISLRSAGSPMFAAEVYLGVLAVVLAIADLTVKRLPARIVWPSYPVALGLLALASVDGAGWGAFVRALLAMVVCGVVFFIAALALPRGLGLGDVSLAGLLGAYCWRALRLSARTARARTDCRIAPTGTQYASSVRTIPPRGSARSAISPLTASVNARYVAGHNTP